MASQDTLRILSLDGGGIRGLSSLLILENIMERVGKIKGLKDPPRPCELFDLIGGTSTGGIIAIMLGRLGMSVDECIRAYHKVAQQAFTRKWNSWFPARPSGTFSAKALENAIKRTIREYCPEPECVARRRQNQQTIDSCPHGETLRFRRPECTKTVVLAITKENVNALPMLFKTYDTPTSFEDCTIWEVARATSAATTFFKPIKVGRDGTEFIDAAFGHNNPCEVLIEEGQRLFPNCGRMCILSIGTGLGDVVTIKDSRLSIIKALKEMATSSKIVASKLNNRYGDSGLYFRFNVDLGLQDITLSDWEKTSTISAHTRNYLAENDRSIQRFVENLLAKGPVGERIPAPTKDAQFREERQKGSAHFAVPFGRNKSFIGRESTLKRLLSLVPPSVESSDCQWTAIVGLGGIGKTQVALEAAFRVRDSYPDCSVFWVPAVDSSSFENAYRKIGQLLKIDGINEKDADAKTLVKKALSESSSSWLLIVDNADNTDLLFDNDTGLINYLPSNWNGSILFTTRNREIISRLDIPEANVVTIEEMNDNEAMELLRMYLDQSQMQDMERSKKLVESLGYLPLALRQAAAYMARTRMSTSKYLDLCQSSDKNMIQLLSRGFEDRHRYKGMENSIATTWLISFRDIEDHHPLAADYLKFMSFLGQKDIPQTLLPPANAVDMEEALGILRAYAFISEREECSTYDMHRLVQLATLNWLKEKGEISERSTRVMQRLAKVFPSPEPQNRALWMGYLPHARRILIFKSIIEDHATVSNILEIVGLSLRHLGQFREAEAMHRQELEIREKVLGPEHSGTLNSVNNLGLALFDLGKYDEAEAMHRRALETEEKVLGPEHPNTLNTINNLANVFSRLGRYNEAEMLYRRVLGIREKVLGSEHPATLNSVNNLGLALLELGKYDVAEAVLRQALEIREKVLGPEHPSTFDSIENVGSILSRLGKHDEAETMYKRALEIEEKVLGPEHPRTIDSVNNLGLAFHRRGRYEEAEAMYRRALETREKMLGPEHPSTLNSINNLGSVYSRLGKHDVAVAMHRRALEIKKRVLGPDHPHTLNSASNLAIALFDLGKQDEAEAMHRQVLVIRERVLGSEHPGILSSLDYLSATLFDLGKYHEAEAMRRRALEIRVKVLGPEHPDTINSVNNLGLALSRLGKHDAAVATHRQALEIREKVLGADHPDTISSANNLGVSLFDLGKYDDAEAMHRRALEIREKVLGRDHPDTSTSANNLAIVLSRLGKRNEAEAMHRRALEIREKAFGPEHPVTLNSVSYLGLALFDLGKYDEAEAMHRRALEIREKVLGRENPDTVNSVCNLAVTFSSLRKYDEAEAMHRRALETREKVLGPEHPATLNSINNLGLALSDLGKYEEAEAMHRRALEIEEKVLGPEHPDTINSVKNLAFVLSSVGKHDEAQAMHRRTLKSGKRRRGPRIHIPSPAPTISQ